MSHPDDNSLELYALGRVPEEEIAGIEEHLLVCDRCNHQLQDIAQFAQTMREAARQLATELIASHHTFDGMVHLFARRQNDGRWLATIKGRTIESGVTAGRREEAILKCRTTFQELFPEHRCTSRCRDRSEDD